MHRNLTLKTSCAKADYKVSLLSSFISLRSSLEMMKKDEEGNEGHAQAHAAVPADILLLHCFVLSFTGRKMFRKQGGSQREDLLVWLKLPK